MNGMKAARTVILRSRFPQHYQRPYFLNQPQLQKPGSFDTKTSCGVQIPLDIQKQI